MADRISQLYGNISEPLTGKALGYKPTGYIGTKVLPLVTFNSLRVVLPVYNKEMFEVPNDQVIRRPLYGLPHTVSVTRSLQEYTLDEVTLGAKIDVRESRAASLSAVPWDPFERAALLAKRLVLNAREKSIADLLAGTTFGYTLNITAGNEWDVKSGGNSVSDPVEHILKAIEEVRKLIGVRPNVLVLGADAWRAAQTNTNVHKNILGVEAPGFPTFEQFYRFFGFEEGYLGDGMYWDGSTFRPFWGDSAYLIYRPANGLGNEEPSFGFTAIASWGRSGDEEVLGVVTRWEVNPYVTEIDYTEFVKPWVAMPQAGAVITNCAS
jgi:hypothetical protein